MRQHIFGAKFSGPSFWIFILFLRVYLITAKMRQQISEKGGRRRLCPPCTRLVRRSYYYAARMAAS